MMRPRVAPIERRALVAVLLGMAVAAASGAQESGLYACTGASTVDQGTVGLTVCDAMPTPTLTDRAEVDNLQVRDGAMVVALEPGGVSEVAGLQTGDVIYRVGGVDVRDAQTAVGSLGTVRTDSDTVVNFLRRGRPYRVKLRAE